MKIQIELNSFYSLKASMWSNSVEQNDLKCRVHNNEYDFEINHSDAFEMWHVQKPLNATHRLKGLILRDRVSLCVNGSKNDICVCYFCFIISESWPKWVLIISNHLEQEQMLCMTQELYHSLYSFTGLNICMVFIISDAVESVFGVFVPFCIVCLLEFESVVVYTFV